jgi:hypothetical protein
VLPPHVERPETWPYLGGESRDERRTPEANAPQLPRTRRLMSWL